MMRLKLFLPLHGILNLRYRPIQLHPLGLTTVVHQFLLPGTECTVGLSGYLELEADGNVRAGCPDQRRGWVVLVSTHIRLLLLVPTGDDGLPETVVPGIGAVSLGRGEFSFFDLAES